MDWLLRLRTLPWSSEGAKSVNETEHKTVQVWRLAAVKGMLFQVSVGAPGVMEKRVGLQVHRAHGRLSSMDGEVCRPHCFKKIPDKSHCRGFLWLTV